ncbi:MAG: hypothetical protein RBS24_00235 [Bacilli bacterium]|nr:hypothetical protein [Bacilli bacterium]
MPEYLRILLAIIVFSMLVALYIGTYLLNKRTKKPAGCEDLTASCTGCAITSCGNHPGEEE